MVIDNGTVIGLGLGIVFLVLICLIIIITVLGLIMRKANAKSVRAKAVADSPTQVPTSQTQVPDIPNKAEFIAAVSAAVAEETGTDVSRIRIHKIEKV